MPWRRLSLETKCHGTSTLAADAVLWSDSLTPFYPLEEDPIFHWIGGSINPGAFLGAVEIQKFRPLLGISHRLSRSQPGILVTKKLRARDSSNHFRKSSLSFRFHRISRDRTVTIPQKYWKQSIRKHKPHPKFDWRLCPFQNMLRRDIEVP